MSGRPSKPKSDAQILAATTAAMVVPWLIVLALPWIVLHTPWFVVESPEELERVRSTLGQLGTLGDMFGMLICLFAGGAFVGAFYAVILQRRQLRHQEQEIERNRVERATASVWQRRTALIETTSFLAQARAAQLAALQAIESETLSGEAKVLLAERGAVLMRELQKNIDVLSRFVSSLVMELEEDVANPEMLRAAFGFPPQAAGAGPSSVATPTVEAALHVPGSQA